MGYPVKFIDGRFKDQTWNTPDLTEEIYATVPYGSIRINGGSAKAFDTVKYERDIASDKPGWFFAYKESK